MTEATTPTPEILAVLPFEDLSKDDQIQHLKDYHGYDAIARDSKVTKATLETYHTGFHVHPYQGNYPIVVAHEHRALSAQDFAGASDLVKALEKPLTITERNALKQLVDNDFDSLNKEIETQAAAVLAARLEESTASFAAKRQEVDSINTAIKDAKDQARKAIGQALDAFEATFKALQEDAESKGITVRGGTTERYYIVDRSIGGTTVEVVGEAEALNTIRADVRREQNSARLAADRRRLGVNRQIMLAAIPEAIRPLVAEIPTAKSLLATVAKQIES
jgi:hypothetical protein